MSSRQIKQEILTLLSTDELDHIRQEICRYPEKELVNPLFSALSRPEELVRWHAISIFGQVVPRLADQDMEAARIVMRRFLWSLNDESGGIGWGAPEAMAEIMLHHDRLAEEYLHMLLSYLRPDGPLAHQDGNFLELPALQCGLLWGIGRLASGLATELVARGVIEDLLPYLQAEDGGVRGLAVWALGQLDDDAARVVLLSVANDMHLVHLYQHGQTHIVTVAELVREALNRNSTPPLLCFRRFFQFAITPGAPAANLDRLQSALRLNPPQAGTLLVLPELWAYGFVYPQLDALSRQTPWLLEQLSALAAQYHILLAGTLIERTCDERGTLLYNTLFFNSSDGLIGKIRKQHLFSYWHEDEWLTAGSSPRPVATPSGMVGGLVCYDLRFPETAKVQCQQGASLLVVSAQWPTTRIDQWRTLLQARAIENQAFVVAGNGCGRGNDGNGSNDLKLGGHSLIIDPGGEILLEAGEEELLASVAIDQNRQQQLRERFNTVASASYPFDDNDKIVSLMECVRIVGLRRTQGQRIVFTNGCFDILHAGHVEYLQQARKQGDFLVVGLNSDRSIKAIKGEKRPINAESQRARVLAALGCVDAVVLFSDSTPLKLITSLLPHVMVKGADWSEDAIVGAREVKANGGKVVRIPFTTEISTTRIIERIRG